MTNKRYKLIVGSVLFVDNVRDFLYEFGSLIHMNKIKHGCVISVVGVYKLKFLIKMNRF